MYRIAVSGKIYFTQIHILSTVYLLPVRKLPRNQGKRVDDSWQCEAYAHSPLGREIFCAFGIEICGCLSGKTCRQCRRVQSFASDSSRYRWNTFQQDAPNIQEKQLFQTACWIHVVSPSLQFLPSLSHQPQVDKSNDKENDEASRIQTWQKNMNGKESDSFCPWGAKRTVQVEIRYCSLQAIKLLVTCHKSQMISVHNSLSSEHFSNKSWWILTPLLPKRQL